MAGVPTFATPSTFLGILRLQDEAAFHIAGIPLDIGTTNRSGARFGPPAIRAASRMLVDGDHPHWWIDPAALSVADIGDFDIALGDIENSLALIQEQAAASPHLIALGGEHTISLPLLRALAEGQGAPLALVHFDAHVDTWPDNFGQVYAHGSVFFHAIEEGLIDPKRTVQIGIRSPMQRDVYDWTRDKGVTIISAQDVHEFGPQPVAQRVTEIVGGAPAYLSFDIDCLDPAFAPGTGTPVSGGPTSARILSVLRKLGALNIVGSDVVEVAPAYDHADITAIAASTIAMYMLGLHAETLAERR